MLLARWRDAMILLAAFTVVVMFASQFVFVVFNPHPPCPSTHYQMDFMGTTVCRSKNP